MVSVKTSLSNLISGTFYWVDGASPVAAQKIKSCCSATLYIYVCLNSVPKKKNVFGSRYTFIQSISTQESILY